MARVAGSGGGEARRRRQTSFGRKMELRAVRSPSAMRRRAAGVSRRGREQHIGTPSTGRPNMRRRRAYR